MIKGVNMSHVTTFLRLMSATSSELRLVIKKLESKHKTDSQ